MIKGYTYINLSLFPVYINDEFSADQEIIGIQRYNSSQWMAYVNNSELDKLFHIINLSDDKNNEDVTSNFYNNYQLITDLFDIILTKYSDYRNQEINNEVDYMLRTKERPVEFTGNRYIANFSSFHPQNNAIILLANPRSGTSRTLIEKRKRLNEYL